MKIQYLIVFMLSLGFVAAGASHAADTGATPCAALHEKPIAVFLSPTDAQIEAMKKERGEKDFYIIADDAMYYQSLAFETLDTLKFPYCFTHEKNQKFKLGNGTVQTLGQECQGWCLILWNGKDKPILTYPVDLSSHEAYLKRAGTSH